MTIPSRLLFLPYLTAATFVSAAGPDFNREVRPILASNCFKCHGPDESARKGGLRLDLREAAVKAAKSGEIAIVPGQVEASELVKRLFTKDPDELMPPESTKHPLTAEQKETLKQWIANGAEYRPHWAFAAPQRPEVPAGEPHPVDAFITAKLTAEHLTPAPAADRYTLVRRVYLDLIGLPPTPAQAEAFVQDQSADAYAKLVDGLLASPHYGERWARRWLDLARYADTNGYEKDRPRNIWPYRDWVIKSLNDDLPFDKFSIAQLAGDMLPNATQEDLVATGFNRNTMLNEEGGIDPLEFRFHAMTDRVGTTATTWLGLTMACAQCHTHKYDPILHTDYYQFMAFLDNADEPELKLQAADAAQVEAKRKAQLQQAEVALISQWPLQDVKWSTPVPKVEVSPQESVKPQPDGSVLLSVPGPATSTMTLVLETTESVDRLRLETLADDSLPAHGPGRVKHGNFVLTEITVTATPLQGGPAVPVKISGATADVAQPGFPVTDAIDGNPTSGWAVDDGKGFGRSHSAVFNFANAVEQPGGTRFTVTLAQQHGVQHTIGRPRISLGKPSGGQGSIAQQREAAVEQAFGAWLERSRQQVVAWTKLQPTAATSNSPTLSIQPDATILASGDITKDDTYEVKVNLPPNTQALRLEVLPDERLPGNGPGLTYYEGPKGDFFVSEFALLQQGVSQKITNVTSSDSSNNKAALLTIDSDTVTGWNASAQIGQRNEIVFNLATPTSGEATIKLEFWRHYACSLGKFRLAASTAKTATAQDFDDAVGQLLAKPTLNPQEHQDLRAEFLMLAPELATASKQLRNLRQPAGGQTTLVMTERPAEHPRKTFLRKRGEYLQPADEMKPNVPGFLPPLPPNAPKNRLSMAQWLFQADNPLTARVTVNREWAAFFGTGLVRTTNDFGYQGELPSHPQLIDWLACEFAQPTAAGGPGAAWSLKRLHRLIVTSKTYQQSSVVSPELLARDPQNRLLARGPRFRLEAEIIRDSALTASQLLTPTLYGAPVRPAQPDGVTEAAYGGSKWNADNGPNRYRRSVYTFLKRTAPFAMFNTFDAPSGEACLARRDVSNTPLQSLTLLNDIAFQEAAQALGKATTAVTGDDTARLNFAFRQVLVRPPSASELAKLQAFLATQRDRLQRGALDGKIIATDNDTALWTLLARVLFNLDETVTKP